MKYKIAVHLAGLIVGVSSLSALSGSACGDGLCQDIPIGGGQTMSATAKTVATSCPVTDGMFVRSYTTLRLDSIATAFGQCQTMLPACTVAGCTCVPGSVYERLIGRTLVWADVTSEYLNGMFSIGTVYGKNPDGSTAFFHVLDSMQSNSTGPVEYLVSSAGEYLLHFQANINTTLCNILPAETPKFDMMVHVRTSLHRGERSNGSLVGGVNLLDPGTGYYQEPGTDTKNTDDWGGAEAAISLIQTVATQWSQSHPTPRIGILDISSEMGGPFFPHSEHQNGLDIDVRYVRNDGAELGVNLSIQNQKKKYSKALTIDLLRKFAANGSLYRILVSPLSGISSADVPGVNIVQTSGHDDHFHVSLVDPDGPDTNNCP